MSDTKLEQVQKDAAIAPDKQAALSPEVKGDSANPKDSKQEKTPNALLVEKKFDRAVYGGISYVGQAGTGILVTNWLTHGKGLKYYDRGTKWIGETLVKKGLTSKTMAEAIESARSPVIVTTMIMIGNLFLLPVKWIENHKPQIIRGMNERDNKKYEARGYVLTEQEKAAQEARLEYLEKEPKQSWRSLGGGRAFGLAAVYATLFALDKPKKLNNRAMEDAFSKSVRGVTEAVGFKKLARSKSMENYTRIGFYDIFYSMISAGGLYVYSHVIEPPKGSKKEGAKAEHIPSKPPKAEAIEKNEAQATTPLANDTLKAAKSPEKLDNSFAGRLGNEAAQSTVEHSL